MFARWLHPEREDVHIEWPAGQLTVNHRLKVVILYDHDPGMPSDRYAELEAHLKRRGYLLQVLVAPATQERR